MPANAMKDLWRLNCPLTVMIIASLLALVISLAGLCVDHRIIHGELVWIKPCKFGVSLALYGASLIWIEQHLTGDRRLFRLTACAALIGAVLELGAIITQALRGTASHFNTATPLDAA